MISKRDVLEISCKILGLTCLIRGIFYFSTVVAAFTTGLRSSVTFVAGPFVSYLVLAFILLKWSRGLASFLVREDQPLELSSGKGWQKPVYTLCLRVVGAVVLIRAVPAIIGAIFQIVLRHLFPIRDTGNLWTSLTVAVVQLALGIYFIGGAKEVVRIALRGSLRERDSDNAQSHPL